MNIDVNKVVDKLTKQLGTYAKQVAILEAQLETVVEELNELKELCTCQNEDEE